MSKKSFFYYLISLFFTFILSYSFYQQWGRVEKIDFSFQQSNLEKKDQSRLIKDLNNKVQPLVGEWIWNVSLSQIRTLIKSDPRVEQVYVLRKWPHRYQVVLLSDIPLFLLLGNKVFYPVTRKGDLIQPLSFSQTPDLPFLRGAVFNKDKKWRKKAVDLFFYLPKVGFFSQENISEIRYSKSDRSFYFYLNNSGLPIRVGENVVEFRPDRVDSVLKYLKQKKINWNVIDARFSHKVIVSLSQESFSRN